MLAEETKSVLMRMAVQSRGAGTYLDVALEMAAVGIPNEPIQRWTRFMPEEVIGHWKELSLETQLVAYAIANDWISNG